MLSYGAPQTREHERGERHRRCYMQRYMLNTSPARMLAAAPPPPPPCGLAACGCCAACPRARPPPSAIPGVTRAGPCPAPPATACAAAAAGAPSPPPRTAGRPSRGDGRVCRQGKDVAARRRRGPPSQPARRRSRRPNSRRRGGRGGSVKEAQDIRTGVRHSCCLSRRRCRRGGDACNGRRHTSRHGGRCGTGRWRGGGRGRVSREARDLQDDDAIEDRNGGRRAH